MVWSGASGSFPDDRRTVYTLIGMGFSAVRTSGNIDALIGAWVKAHPHAQIVRVANFGPLAKNRTDSERIWAWLVDGNSNLNLELVRQGACSANAMTAPNRVRVLLSPDEYAKFTSGLPALERLAKRDRLGIWR
jgi:endonuclease YncB( thermonuclease family)